MLHKIRNDYEARHSGQLYASCFKRFGSECKRCRSLKASEAGRILSTDFLLAYIYADESHNILYANICVVKFLVRCTVMSQSFEALHT